MFSFVRRSSTDDRLIVPPSPLLDEDYSHRLALFRFHLHRDLKVPPPSGFNLRRLVLSFDIFPDDVRDAVEDFYSRFSSQVFADGACAPAARLKLDRLAGLLCLGPVRIEAIELRAKEPIYRRAVADALAAGSISPGSVTWLRGLRASLSLSDADSLSLASDLVRDAYLFQLRRIAYYSTLHPGDLEDLVRFKQAFDLDGPRTRQLLGHEATGLFELAFACIIADGVVTPEERAFILWLQTEIGIAADEFSPYLDRLDHIAKLADYRNGKLSTIRTSKLLDGGELCYWESPCQFEYQTRDKQTLRDQGMLLVTDRKVRFNAPSVNVSFPPWKILDVDLVSGSICLAVDAYQGTGVYSLERIDELEAILVGLVRRTKYQLADGFKSAVSRHIPEAVKRAVWNRDGGQCVLCGAFGRGACLEFDHIIPFSRGGSNSESNLRILCRPCNSDKSNHI